MSPIQARYMKRMKRMKYMITSARVLLADLDFFILWEAAAYFKWIDAFIFSSPSRIVKTFLTMAGNGSIFYHSAVTMLETGLSFCLMSYSELALAVPFYGSSKTVSAVLVALSRPFKQSSKISTCAYDYRMAWQ